MLPAASSLRASMRPRLSAGDRGSCRHPGGLTVRCFNEAPAERRGSGSLSAGCVPQANGFNEAPAERRGSARKHSKTK